MRWLTDHNLRLTQNWLEWVMAGLLLPIGLVNLQADWLTGLTYIALAVLLCPLTAGLRWLKVLIAFIALLVAKL